jgi:hypothetical protein
MIYTAPCVMFLMRADALRGQVGGGWALEIVSFLGPVKCHRADRRVPFRKGGGGGSEDLVVKEGRGKSLQSKKSE